MIKPAAPFVSNHSSVFQAIFPGRFSQISYTATSQNMELVAATLGVVWLFSTTDCWVKIGNANPTAVPGDGDSFMVRGGIYRAFGVRANQSLAVVRSTADGVLDIHEGGSN